ncbi:hypothetical protein MM440_00900 [Arsenicicoccus piscis]|uniref:hypothetical protein n=1 Tax=Arsenicicoccus piscis TaxID=673954 RepID=UPI001F4CFB76|nr:hypothetical protein [Arsenicicoccus piscis]MCH8626380.1 hypothetical protein [Arsenicicoccus piscis]
MPEQVAREPFDEFVAARGPVLYAQALRLADGREDVAEDQLRRALVALRAHWDRVGDEEGPEAFVRDRLGRRRLRGASDLAFPDVVDHPHGHDDESRPLPDGFAESLAAGVSAGRGRRRVALGAAALVALAGVGVGGYALWQQQDRASRATADSVHLETIAPGPTQPSPTAPTAPPTDQAYRNTLAFLTAVDALPQGPAVRLPPSMRSASNGTYLDLADGTVLLPNPWSPSGPAVRTALGVALVAFGLDAGDSSGAIPRTHLVLVRPDGTVRDLASGPLTDLVGGPTSGRVLLGVGPANTSGDAIRTVAYSVRDLATGEEVARVPVEGAIAPAGAMGMRASGRYATGWWLQPHTQDVAATVTSQVPTVLLGDDGSQRVVKRPLVLQSDAGWLLTDPGGAEPGGLARTTPDAFVAGSPPPVVVPLGDGSSQWRPMAVDPSGQLVALLASVAGDVGVDGGGWGPLRIADLRNGTSRVLLSEQAPLLRARFGHLLGWSDAGHVVLRVGGNGPSSDGAEGANWVNVRVDVTTGSMDRVNVEGIGPQS